ncbi:hypothetical protein [Kordia periserrulae]|nr:hypothetical protein [Kordia periserrulae]
MEKQFQKKSTHKNTATAAAHQNKGKVLEDYREQTILQRKAISSIQKSNSVQRIATGVIQLFSTPSLLRFSDLKIGRSKNAGIVDEHVKLATGLEFTQHFHCNGWDEQQKTFTSFTGTFNVGGTKYHYTIPDGGSGAWTADPGTPPQNALAMKIRTEKKLQDLTKAE